MSEPSSFRIRLAEPSRLEKLEAEATPELRRHFDLIKRGLTAIPGVPAEAFYGAVTLRALALVPGVFRGVFLAEHHAMKQGEIDNRVKELVAIAIATEMEGDDNAACGPYHMGAARFEGASELEINAARNSPGGLPDDVRRQVNFGFKAAFHPREMTDADVEGLKQLGYSDAAVVELIATAMITYLLTALNRTLNLKEG